MPNVVLNGGVNGEVHSTGHVELATHARVSGNVYYRLIEMARGAEVNGNLVRCSEDEQQEPLLGSELPTVADS